MSKKATEVMNQIKQEMNRQKLSAFKNELKKKMEELDKAQKVVNGINKQIEELVEAAAEDGVFDAGVKLEEVKD